MDQALNPAVPKPDHVPDHLVYDFGFTQEPEYLTDPFARASQVIKDAPPIFWTPRNGGMWIIAGYDAVGRAARNWDVFSSTLLPQELLDALTADLPPGTPTPMNAVPASVNPPVHGLYRAPLNQVFSPKVAIGLKEEIRDLAIELIERARPNGGCDLVSEIVEPLPVQMFLKLFGLPLERQAEYLAIAKKAMDTSSRDVNSILQGSKTLADTYTDTLIERRDNPQKDIISAMWAMEIDGKPMTLEIMQSYCLALFLAGLDTVMNAMAHGIKHLALHPDLQDEMRANPKAIPQMTEEMLRLYSFAMPIRAVAEDCEYEGATLRKGEFVHFFLAGADRDASQFDDPETFDMGRDLKAHLGFGAGPHRCVGMHLARVELHVFYEEFLKRVPRFRLDPDKEIMYHGGIVTGPNELHLLWDS